MSGFRFALLYSVFVWLLIAIAVTPGLILAIQDRPTVVDCQP